MKTLLMLAALAATLTTAEAWGGWYVNYRYSLPGDWRWPTARQFGHLKRCISGEVYLKGDVEYAPYTFSTRTNTPQPAVMVYPETIRDVQKAIGFARWHGMRMSVLSTGHHADVRNIADNAVHIVMTNFNHKEIVDAGDEKHIKVGPGQTFGDIAAFVRSETNEEWAIATGGDSTVGPYGWTTGGGHGYLSRMYGYGVDHVVSMRVVLTSGFVVTASETHHSELFRSLRGSGGSAFGVCVSMTIRLHPTPPKVTAYFGVYFANSDPAYANLVMSQYSSYIGAAPKEAGGYYLTLGAIPGAPTFIVSFCYGDDCDEHISKIEAIPGCVPGILPGSCVKNANITYYELVNALAPSAGGNQYSVSTSVEGADAMQLLQATTAWVVKEESIAVAKFCTQSSVLGGAARTIDPAGDSTSISPAMRAADIQVTCIATWEESTTVEERLGFVSNMTQWEADTLRPIGTGWVYWNEAQHDFPLNDWKERYWGSMQNYNRMMLTKVAYDPLNALTCYHCIGWDFDGDVDPAVCPEQECTCSNNPTGACNN